MIYPLVFLVALGYSCVGHGGASGYLAVLALLGHSPKEMAPSALLLNLLVSGTALWAFVRAGHFRPNLVWPFAVASVPAAFLGGLTEVASSVYSKLLVIALLFAAFRLVLSAGGKGENDLVRPLRLVAAVPVGAGIGFLSGIIGVGGGIFLSPLMLLMRWADAKKTAAASAAFIWVNSLAGLFGHAAGRGVHLTALGPLVVAAFLGGIAGSHIGAYRISGRVLRRVLACVLAVAAIKIYGTAP